MSLHNHIYMKLELKDGVVETLFDYAFAVYTGPDAGRNESAIKGRPFMPKGIPVLIDKKVLGKLLRTGLYVEWGSVPGQESLQFDPAPKTEEVEEPVEIAEPESLEEALMGDPAPAKKISRRKKFGI